MAPLYLFIIRQHTLLQVLVQARLAQDLLDRICYKIGIHHPRARPIIFCFLRPKTAQVRATIFLAPWLGLGSLGLGVQVSGLAGAAAHHRPQREGWWQQASLAKEASAGVVRPVARVPLAGRREMAVGPAGESTVTMAGAELRHDPSPPASGGWGRG